ncbi:MAG: hypothetical protein H7323_03895 [Frankiales bacterium]|nr:hypothetical protein [Frankiales bacterium]
MPVLAALVALPLGAGPAAAPAGVVPGITASGLDAFFAPDVEPGDAMLAARGGAIPTGAFARASAQSAAIGVRTAATDPALAQSRWTLRGPTNVGGRVLDVVVDPLRQDGVYLATASGGVWHSTDAGKRYRSVWPDSLTQAVGALAISRTGVLWAGTGEAGPGGGSITYGGTGVYRSVNGGKTWQQMGLAGSERIGRIVVDPRDEKTIWVAANGPLYTRGGERGLYKSTDAGRSWKLVLAGTNDTTGAVDVALDPKDPRTVYATTWDRLREPDRRTYTGPGSGAFKSTDGGASWTRLGGPALASSPQLGRLGIAIAPSDPNRVYILAPPEGSLPTALYRSNDAGASFLPVVGVPVASVNTAFSTLYPWWFGRVYVDPDQPDRVFTTGVNLARTDDGGQSFSAVAGLHADQHGMAWDPRVKNRVYVGNDGGSYTSSDDAVTFKHGTYMPWNQPFSVSVSQQNPRKILVGLQDNGGNRNYVADDDPGLDQYNDITGGDGTEMTFDPADDSVVYGCSQYGACARSASGGGGMSGFENQIVGSRKNWLTPIEFDPLDPTLGFTASEVLSMTRDRGPDQYNDITGGDGTEMAFDPADDSVVYGCSQYGACARSASGGDGMSGFENQIVGSRKNWLTPIEFDPLDPTLVFTASEIVSMSSDRGLSWKPISLDLTGGPGRETNPLFRAYGTVTTISAAMATHRTIYAGTDDGRVSFTHDGGTTWTRASGLPTDWVTSVAIDRRDPAKVAYASFSGFRSGAQKALVFRTADGGATWKDVTGNLPQAPVNDVLPIGDAVAVATDVGVFLSRDLGRSWSKVGAGLPNAPITELSYQVKTGTLLAANFGRGAYSVALPTADKAAKVAAAAAANKAVAPGVKGPVGSAPGAGTTQSVAGDAPTAPDLATVPVADSRAVRLPVGGALMLGLLAALGGLLWLRPDRRRS